MSKAISRQTKEVVYNVYNYFKNRKLDPLSFENANDINLAKTVAEATGFSATSIKKIVKEARSTEAQSSTVTFKAPRKNLTLKKRIEIDSLTEGVIRRKIIQWLHVKKCSPSLKKLNAELKQENIINCSLEYLRQTILRLGFKYIKSKRKLVIECHNLMRQRWHYVRDIKKYRKDGKSIIFLDETYVYQTNKGHRVVIVHAGSRNGFVNNALLMFKSSINAGDYHGDMNATNFSKWIDEKLLPNIPPNSVIVMDNAAYHNTQIDKKPSIISLKTEMQQWLDRRGVRYDSAMRKCDLMKIIIDELNTEKRYNIDETLKENGHTVLCLPPHHQDLNPMELVWRDIKGELARTSIDSDLDKKMQDLKLVFANYSVEKWLNCDNNVMKIENEYYKIDQLFDYILDRCIIQLNEKDCKDDGDDDEEEDEDDEEQIKIKSEDESDMEIDLE